MKITYAADETISEYITRREAAFTALVRQHFGSYLPPTGTWCRMGFGEDPSIIALVPVAELENPNLLDLLVKERKYPYCQVTLASNR